MFAPAPVIRQGNGRLRLDTKFVEGMRMHQAMWDGPVHCLLWEGAASIVFGADYEVQDLGFSVEALSPGQEIGGGHIAGAAVVAAAADMSEVLGLAPLCREAGVPLVYAVEYTLKTRHQIVMLDMSRNFLRKMRSILWNLKQERRRRAAFRAADAVQFNGYPAQDAYASIVQNRLLYLDGRMRREMMATPREMTARARRLADGNPLRLAYSGRLATMKGAQDLLPIARALKGRGVAFTLDIFGTGELEAELLQGIRAGGLSEVVRLHAPVDFATELVPYLRTSADVFLSCHRQADPSCSYLESLGCGLPIIGYDNEMWRALHIASGAGWALPMGKTDRVAAQIAHLARNPGEVTAMAAKALDFGKAHDFEHEFRLRMDHYARLARQSTQLPVTGEAVAD